MKDFIYFAIFISLISCQSNQKTKTSLSDNAYTELTALGSYPNYYYNLANEYSNNGQIDEAIQAYKNCISTSKNQTFVEDGMFNLSLLYFEKGDNENGFALFDSLLNRQFTWLNWYSNNDGEFTKSEEYQSRLVKIDSIEVLKSNPANCKFHYNDLENFITAFNESKNNWDKAPQIFYNHYFSKASKGLYYYQRFKIQSSSHLFAYRVQNKQNYFTSILPNLESIKGQEGQLRTYLNKFKALYDDAIFPDIYFLVGCFNAGGTSSPFGLLIGSEMHSNASDSPLNNFNDWEQKVVRGAENLPLITIHELVHIQQNNNFDNLLGNAIYEGAADFISELICGAHINQYVHDWANELEMEVWQDFELEMMGENSRNWIGNANNAKDKPADLGYYIGFKICESYYNLQTDKKQAVKDILTIRDYNEFFEKSGYGK